MRRFLPWTLLFVFAASCTPSHNNPSPPPHTGPDIYLTGYAGYTLNGQTTIQGAVYWKNDTLVPLPGGQYATGMALSDTDVYVSGITGGPGGTTRAAFWKNGVITKMDAAPSYASAIAVSGSDLYLVGNCLLNQVYEAAYWKSGSWMPLSNNAYSAANAINISGSNVYIAGKDNARAVYWKNNVEQILQEDTISSASAIAIVGNDIYVAGSITADGSHPTAAYWKNGVRVDLEDSDLRPAIDNTYASGIAVSGHDVYVTGFFNSTNPVYWKNGVLHKLSGGGFENVTQNQNGIVVMDNDVYISGIGNFYWKNDALTKVGNGYATGILVH